MVAEMRESPLPIHPITSSFVDHRNRFLWKFANGQLKVYKWTGRNDYVTLCEPDSISFGGG